MPRTFLGLALALAVLLAATALPVHGLALAADEQTADAGDALPDVPVKLSRGMDDTPAHPSESQRRVEAPERLESPLQQLAGADRAGPQSATSTLGRLGVQRAGPSDSTAATPLHLRHCVFLC